MNAEYSKGIIQVSQSTIVSSCLDLANKMDKIEPEWTFVSDQILLQFQEKLSHHEDNAEKSTGVQEHLLARDTKVPQYMKLTENWSQLTLVHVLWSSRYYLAA